jgi:hypothetical protein
MAERRGTLVTIFGSEKLSTRCGLIFCDYCGFSSRKLTNQSRSNLSGIVSDNTYNLIVPREVGEMGFVMPLQHRFENRAGEAVASASLSD